MHVLEVSLALPLRAGGPGAGVADSDHQDLRSQGLEPVALLEVLLQLLEQRVLEMEDALTDLADGVLVVLARDLVVGGAGA